MSDTDYIFGILPQIVNVPLGVTQAVYVPSYPRQCEVQFRLVSGGTLFLMPASNGQTYASGASGQPIYGSTLSGATLAAMFATFAYVMGATGPESIMTLQGPSSFYLASAGSSAVVAMTRKLSSAP